MDLIAGIYGESRNLEGPLKQDSNDIETAVHILDHLNAEKRSLASLCRTCLVVKSDMYSLVHHRNDELVPDNEQLPDIFSSFTNIKVNPDEGLPLQICELCKVQLENGYEFRQKCLSSNSILKKFLKPMALCINASTRVNKTITVNDLLNKLDEPEKPDLPQNSDLPEEPDATEELDTLEKMVFIAPETDALEKPVYILPETNTRNKPVLIAPDIDTLEKPVYTVPETDMKEKPVVIVPETLCTQEEQDIPEDNHNNEEHVEDVQYLEDMSDSSDQENYCIIQVQPLKIPIEVAQQPKLETGAEELQNIKVRPNLSKWPKFSCERCPKKFKTALSLKGHIRRTHFYQDPNDPLGCDRCKDRFVAENDLRLHMSLHDSDGSVWTCNECHKQFKRRGGLRRHISRHMEGKRHECSVCGKRFAERYALHRHARVHTGQQLEKKHMCHLCDKRYSNVSRLQAHLAWHRGERPCVCAVCGKTFPSARLLASHSIVHTEIKPFACHFCDKRFRHETTRTTHHRTHTGERPYVCAICGKAFIQHCNLALHMRCHTGEKPYTCPTCKRNFSSGSTLKAHTRTHTGDRPYTCHHCGNKYSRAGFATHIRIHTEVRPHACPMCTRRFPTASRLRDHERVHTGEKPFECDQCRMKFTTKGQLQKHMKTHEAKKKKSKKERKPKIYNLGTPVFLIDENAAQQINLSEFQNTQKLHMFDPNQIIVGTELEHHPVVSEELVLQENGEVKTDTLVANENEIKSNENEYQSGALCLDSSVDYVTSVGNYENDMELVPINGEGVSIPPQNAMIEGNAVNVYQIDQNLVHLHNGCKVTIGKIGSKINADM